MSTNRPVTHGTHASTGVEGNSRLTSTNGMVLLALLAVEGFTILRIRQLITLHVFLGIVLLAPVLLKTGSTTYRFARYYTGSRPYLDKGPPHPLLRPLGPLVIVSSLMVLGTGVGLLAVKPGHAGPLLLAHQASFIVWLAVMTIHVLGHLREAAMTTWRELHGASGDPATRRRAARFALIAFALILGVAAATTLLPAAAPWITGRASSDSRGRSAVRDDTGLLRARTLAAVAAAVLSASDRRSGSA